MSDQSTSSKNDKNNPSASNIKFPKPKNVVRILRAPKPEEKCENPGASKTKSPKPKNVVRILRAPGSKSNDESIDEGELRDFMNKGNYLIASSGSEGEEEPLMFRAIRKSKRHQLEYMRAVEDFRKKKSGMSERKELCEDEKGPSSGIWRYLNSQGSSKTKVPEQKSVVRILRAPGQSSERKETTEEDRPRILEQKSKSFSSFGGPDFRFGPPDFIDFDFTGYFWGLGNNNKSGLSVGRKEVDEDHKGSGNENPGVSNKKIPELETLKGEDVESFLRASGLKEFDEDQRRSNAELLRRLLEIPDDSNTNIPEPKSVVRVLRAPRQSSKRTTEDRPRNMVQISCRPSPEFTDFDRREAYARRVEESRMEGIENLLNPETKTSLEATMSFAKFLDRQATGPVDPENTFEARLNKSLEEYQEKMKKSSSEE